MTSNGTVAPKYDKHLPKESASTPPTVPTLCVSPSQAPSVQMRNVLPTAGGNTRGWAPCMYSLRKVRALRSSWSTVCEEEPRAQADPKMCKARLAERPNTKEWKDLSLLPRPPKALIRNGVGGLLQRLSRDSATAVPAGLRSASRHNRHIAKQCSQCGHRCLDVLHVPLLPLDGSDVTAVVHLLSAFDSGRI